MGGGDLSNVGAKRSARWLYRWLGDPKSLNADHRMPVFTLSKLERKELAVYLSSVRGGVSKELGKEKRVAPAKRADSIDRARVALGRKLVDQSRCAACHTIPGVKHKPPRLPDLSQSPNNHKNTCLQTTAEVGKRRPAFLQLGVESVSAIGTFLISRPGKLSVPSDFDRGRLVLERRNCTGCHPRGTQTGIVETAGRMSKLDPELRGQSQGMIPPSLSAVGDKLLDDALKTAIAGEQKTPRLPWLRVRMPRFHHTKSESAALQAHLIGRDRIPSGAPLAAKPPAAKLPADSQVLVTGQTLVGIRGFSCIACHKVGDYEPRNVALGTRGSDLMQLAGRMRKPFFDRWTRNPIRVVPGMEMPSYHSKPVPGVLKDDVNLQLAVLWKAINDKRFKPPTNPSVVEQFVTVQPGARARVIRDVFTVPKENGGGYVARSLAIGLNNGHNLLFDLDTYSLRGWYFGDFARQRTQGKSWYWDMAGVPVMTGFQPGLDFALLPMKGKNKKPILPFKQGQVHCRTHGYAGRKDELAIQYSLWFRVAGTTHRLVFLEVIKPSVGSNGKSGWHREIVVHGPGRPGGFGNLVTGDHHVLVSRPKTTDGLGQPRIDVATKGAKWQSLPGVKHREFVRMGISAPGLSLGPTGQVITLRYTATLKRDQSKVRITPKVVPLVPESVSSTPGFTGTRLPISRGIMPTALTWLSDRRLALTSLKGHVFLARDTNGDGVEDRLHVFERGLAAPYGILASDNDLLVSHKPELIRLTDKGGKSDPSDGRASARSVLASGWGYTDNYHDWTCGIVRDKAGNLYVGLGSDYSQPNRPKEHARWRGKVVRISPKGKVTPVGHSFRYPTGLAMNGAGDIFVTDNQGVQNTFNEINHLKDDRYYGVPSRHEKNRKAAITPPAIQVPHPWTRSVNGIFFLPTNWRAAGVSLRRKTDSTKDSKQLGGLTPAARRVYQAFAGHGIGCEYDSRFLIRFTLQKVGGEYQGACYAFSRPGKGLGKSNFLGPLCGGVAPDGAIYIGSIYDSGWLGGRNTGDIVRLVPNGKLPNGIRELRVTKDGFAIDFIKPVDRTAASKPDNYTISGYTRVWKGSYATPDSGRHTLKVAKAVLSRDGKTVRLTVPGRRAGQYVYDVTCGKIGTKDQSELWPATGYYTLHRIPK